MNLQAMVIGFLALGVLLAGMRMAMRTPAVALRGRIGLLLLQPVLGVLLYFTLFPPAGEQAADRLVLTTASSTAAQLDRYRAGSIVLALPEAPALPGVPRVPDVGTALRRHPEASRLLVIGAGLVARDREAARGHALEFAAAPLPRGVVELWSPTQVSVAARWQVSGRVQDVPGGSIELLDPAGRRSDSLKLGADGRFTLRGSAPAPGSARFTLRVRDAGAQVVEAVAVPLQVVPGAALRVLVLAGGPSPELKYLRRWALDAGTTLQTQIALGAGLSIGDAPVPIDAATLRGFDLVVLDERAWRALGAGRKATLRDALRDGLGVLLRVTAPLSAADRRELSELGFTVDAADIAQTVSLPSARFSAASRAKNDPSTAADEESALLLSRQPLRVAAADALALLRDDAGAPLASWRSVGQGRLGLWWLGDTHRLVLAGESAAHGQLWSEAFATLARQHGPRLPWLASEDPRPQQRLMLCGLAKGASVEAADGARTPLLIEATADAGNCAAYWPGTAGWQWLRSGGASVPFHVRAWNEAPGLLAQTTRAATGQLVTQVASTSSPSRISVPGPRWPWFLGWLLASALSWWLERRWLR